MEDRKLNEQESLDVIMGMIANTRNRIEKNNGTPFLIFGYMTVIISILIWYLLSKTHNPYWNFLWFTLPILGYPLNYMNNKKNPTGVKTYIDSIITNIWAVLGIVAIVISSLCFIYPLPIFFIIVLLMGIGTTLTGLIAKFKAATYFGAIGIASSIAFLFIHGLDQLLIFAVIFVYMMIIPGHILNYMARKQLKGVK